MIIEKEITISLKDEAINNSIKNCFFLWSNALILVLTSIPVFSFFISKIFNTAPWEVPKIYELKLYAFAMLACMVLPITCTIRKKFFCKTYVKHHLYLLFLYPAAVFLFSTVNNKLLSCLSVFILSLLGISIFIYEAWPKKKIAYNLFYKYYTYLVCISVSASVFLILHYSNDLVFTLRNSWKIITCLFVAIFGLVRWGKLSSKYCIWLLPFFLFAATFFSMGGTDVTHYSFFLGPVIESIYGHYHPLELNVQYGAGLTTFLVLYFKLTGTISFANMQLLLKTLTFIQFLLVYCIGVSIYQSKKIAFLVLLTAMFFSFYSVNGWLYYMAPSIGFLRFGFIYLIVFCYSLQNKYLSPRTVNYLTALLGSLAFIWSFESAIYTLPALFFAEYIGNNLRKFLPIFAVIFFVVLIAYLSPFILREKWPPLLRYSEYVMVYANGFGQIKLNRMTSFWWLYPLMYGYLLIKILLGDITNKIIVALTIYGMAIFTYFGGRSHPAFLLVVSIPFIMLTAYSICNLKVTSLVIKQLLFSLFLMVFFYR